MSQSGTYVPANGGSHIVQTITGNTGGPVPPTAGNINLDTAHSTVLVAGNPATSTLTIDFGLSNLLLGSSGTFITSAVRNVSLGNGALQLLGSGTDNVAIGSAALSTANLASSSNTIIGSTGAAGITSGSNNIGIGSSVGNNWSIGSESNNISIGNLGVTSESNVIHIGTQGSGAGQQNTTFIAGITGVNVGSVANVVSIATGTGQLGTTAITAGSGITVTPGANTITIASTGGLTWSIITVNQTAAVNNGYICNKAGTLQLLLPAASAVGDMLRVTGINTALGWQITQAAGQQIFFGTSSTTLGAGGSLESSAIRDAVELVCIAANTTWQVLSSIGNITVV